MNFLQIDNLIFSSLSESPQTELKRSLEIVELKFGQILSHEGDEIESVYFPTSGLICAVLISPDQRQQEVGVYGKDGVGGASVLLGAAKSLPRHQVYHDGFAARISTEDFLSCCDRCPEIKDAVLKYIHVLNTQLTFTAFSNAQAGIEERLARWLLMCHVRVESVNLRLTHELLSAMMSVRRPSVTDAIHRLEARQLIRASRGNIEVLDRTGLEQMSGFSYGAAEQEHAKLIGPWLDYSDRSRLP